MTFFRNICELGEIYILERDRETRVRERQRLKALIASMGWGKSIQ